jgi:hypothetical protein
MHFLDANFKGHMIISLMTSLLRANCMRFIGYRESDFTYWGAIGTWNIATVVALVIYEIAARIIESRRSNNICTETLTREDTIELA